MFLRSYYQKHQKKILGTSVLKIRGIHMVADMPLPELVLGLGNGAVFTTLHVGVSCRHKAGNLGLDKEIHWPSSSI